MTGKSRKSLVSRDSVVVTPTFSPQVASQFIGLKKSVTLSPVDTCVKTISNLRRSQTGLT